MSKFLGSRKEILDKIFASQNLDDYKNFALKELTFNAFIRSGSTGFSQDRYVEPIRNRLEQAFLLLGDITSSQNVIDAQNLIQNYDQKQIPFSDDAYGIFASTIDDKFRRLVFVFSSSRIIDELDRHLSYGDVNIKEFFGFIDESIWSERQRFQIENGNFPEGEGQFDVYKKYLNEIENNFNSSQEKLSLLYSEKVSSLNKQSEIFSNNEKATRDRLAVYLNSQRLQINKLKSDLASFITRYNEQIRLEAPVVYWNKKERASFWAKLGYSTCFLILFALVALLYWLSFESFIRHFIDPAIAKDKYPVFGMAIFISASAFSFWMLRIFAKLALSSHHLQIDAEERSIMIQTYLSLAEDGKVSDKEREIVLSPIFKPTSDGIIKEEPQLEPVLTSLLRRS